MILDEIVAYNFGVFRGRQRAILTPPSRDKNIILFGGLNGNGKTTIIEAVQLALYGKLAASLKQKNIGYNEYLRKSINHCAKLYDGASVEVAFRSAVDGDLRNYRVCRSWSVQGERVRENLEVFVDETFDRVLTETWLEQVECFFPARLSPLFFFDGERIETLAAPERSAQLLKTAIYALLGIDLVDRLKVDLLVLDRQKRKTIKKGPDRLDIENLERELANLAKCLDELKQERASLQNKQDRAARHLNELNIRFSAEGGELLESYQELEQTRSEVQAEQQAIEEQLVRAATGALPLMLVKDLLYDVVVQAQQEEEAAQAEVLFAAITDRSSKLLQEVEKNNASKSVIQIIKDFFQQDRQQLCKTTEIDCYLDLNKNGLRKADALLQGLLGQEQTVAAGLVKQSDGLETTLQELDKKLAMVPDEDALSDLIRKREQAKERLYCCEQQLANIDKQLEELEKRKTTLSTKLEVLLRSDKKAELDNIDIQHFLKHSKRVTHTLDRFRISLVSKYISQLENLIFESYRSLLRKNSLVSSLKIDPETCVLELHNGSKHRLPPERLSAGERQLLAISMLWGLSRAADRPLPVIIDTPLGRLDSAHRMHLVERYFPFASHQVLLLSTDEEIDENYFQKLSPQIGHAYLLNYDDSSSSSSIVPGYFW